ncbi:hypothetical protein [Fulvivirga sediminis]|uniref:Secreted protein n=1 Tax=Fulvivirga sediminis TaxID=2803949 RepID=A0A937F965_9BACT|nr:hypothetical protein [Fulvivirga sediminis]MBL3657995.1 hypothetical protein [Fulvivirga sediminis]
MKQLPIFIIILLSCINSSFAQFNPIKKFDYTLLEGRTLWVPKFDLSDKAMKRLIKKDKLKEYERLSRSATELTNLWSNAMKNSSYDATDYIIKKFEPKEFLKEKPKDALALMFMEQRKDGQVLNISAQIWSAYPKKRPIASTVINDLDITDENDLILIINMLNNSLEGALAMEESGDKSVKAMKNKYKSNFVKVYETLPKKTFLVPEYEDEKKADKKNEDLKEAIQGWSLCDIKMVSEAEINQKRKENSTDYIYWKNIPYYTGTPIVYNINMIISTESDVILFVFMGKKKLKASNLEEAQKKMQKSYDKFKKDM